MNQWRETPWKKCDRGSSTNTANPFYVVGPGSQMAFFETKVARFHFCRLMLAVIAILAWSNWCTVPKQLDSHPFTNHEVDHLDPSDASEEFWWILMNFRHPPFWWCLTNTPIVIGQTIPSSWNCPRKSWRWLLRSLSWIKVQLKMLREQQDQKQKTRIIGATPKK
jgi:hypothetical protein